MLRQKDNNWRGAWNKVLSESFCNVKFSLIFSTKYKVIWKESMAIDQKSLKAFFHAPFQFIGFHLWILSMHSLQNSISTQFLITPVIVSRRFFFKFFIVSHHGRQRCEHQSQQCSNQSRFQKILEFFGALAVNLFQERFFPSIKL